MATSESVDQLAAALVAAQAEMKPVDPTSTNPFFNSKYADLASLVEMATPILTNHGLAVSQFVSHDGDRNTLVTLLLHSSGQFISDEMLLMMEKGNAQAQGSAITYARRYAYQSALGIVVDADDDGNEATQTQRTDTEKRTCEKCKQVIGDDDPIKALGNKRYEHKTCPTAQTKFDLAAFKNYCATNGLDPLDVVAHAALDKTLGELTEEDRPALMESITTLSKSPSGKDGERVESAEVPATSADSPQQQEQLV